MKRNFKLLVAVVVLVATVFTLASCAAIQGFIDKLKPEQPVHEHTFSEEWSYDETNHWHAATCTDTEECATATSNVTAHSYYANGHCSVCGAVDPEYVPPVPECTEHSYSVEETKAPTCTEDGEKTFTCDECGYSYTQAVAALGHTEEKVEGTAPTCTETGLSDGKVCTVCEEITKAQVTINATGHNYVEGTCSACGAEDPDYKGVKTYVLDVQTLTAFAAGDKVDGAVEEYSSFYTIYYSAKTKIDTTKNKTWSDGYTITEGLRLNWGGTTAINDDVKDEAGNVTGYVTKNAIKIVVNGTATVKVWWNCGGDGREIGIFDENGELVVASQTDDVFTEGTEGVGAGKNNNYLSELTISKPGTYYIGTDNTNAIKNGGNIIFKVETKVTPVEEEPANEIEATTTDNNCWVDKVTFTAQGEGNYTFSLPAGLGAWEVNDCDAWPPVNGPYVDYYNNAAGETFTVGLEAGATLEFYIGSESKQNWVIEWTYEACDVEGGGSVGGGEVTDNEELALGENSIVLGEEHAVDGKDYTFVVTEAGTYTFASDSLLAIVFDSTGMQLGRYQVTLEAGTYTVKLISMAGAGTYSVNVTVATAGGDDGSDTPTEPDGSEENPYVWETLPESATADGDEINMIYYTFTATQSVPLTVTYSTANSWWTLTDKTDPSLSTQGSQSAENTMTLVAGHEYVLGLGVWSAEETDPTVTISLGDPIDPETCVHEWSQVWYHEDIVSATCTTPGAAVYRCDICKTYKTEATEINPNGHDYVTNTETYVAPTCQTDGYREATCSYCNDHQEYELSSEDYGFHDMVVDKEEYPTCTAAGCYIAHCQTEGCDYSVNDTYDPNGHYNYYLTCGQSGECLECGETFTKEHNLVWNPATCTEAAFCWDCNSSVGEPLGHTPGDAADCENDQICTVCEEVIADKLGHTAGATVVENNVDPDCVSAGSYDNVVYCTACNEELSRETITVDAKGHTPGDAADCENDQICTVCEEVIADKLGHTAGATVVENNVDPDCVSAGSYDNVVYCTACNEELSRETITVDALGHSYTDGYCTCQAVDPDYYFPVTIPEALEAADGWNVEVSGTVCAINTAWSDSYGNITVTIVDAEGNELYVYRLATNVALGDIITIKGAMATYNGRQIGAGATAEITGHDESYDYTEMTIKEALAAEDNTNVIVTGTVVKINTAYSSSYNNISITISDDEGNTLYIYRLAGGSDLALNDIITIKGAMATYNGARQITGGTYTDTGADHTCSVYADPTCTDPSLCVVCGAADQSTEALGHSYTDGVCVCGAKEPSDSQTTASVSISEYAAANGWSNSTKYTTLNVDENITVTATGGSNTGKYYTSGTNWRMYQNESPQITVAAAEGKTIVSVKITYVVDKTGILTLNGEQITSDTVVNVNASSITFSVGNTSSTVTNGQVRITAIEVIYA